MIKTLAVWIEATLYVKNVRVFLNPDRAMCLCWQVGSMEHLYTLRDSRGRPDRATFERLLANAEGVSIFKCWIKCPSHMGIWRVDQAAKKKTPKKIKLFFFSLWCLCNTAGNGFVTAANQNVQPLRRDCLIRLTRPRQGEFTLWHQFWFYTACICKLRFIWLLLLF